MNNARVAELLDNIADLLELKGESVFKVRAYQKAARSIEHYPVELEQLAREGKLRDVPGIGEAIDKKITELLTTGKLEYYENLRAEFPEGFTRLMEIPGIGPKTAMRLHKELAISTVEEMEKALEDGRVAELPRMGKKSAEKILKQLLAFRRKDRRISIAEALPAVEEIIAALRKDAGITNLTPAGSLRRFKETIGDIDLMGATSEPDRVLKAFTHLPQVVEVIGSGPTKASVRLRSGLQVDLRIVDDDSFGSLLQYFTGSKDHNIELRERSLKQGLSLSEYGIKVLETGKLEKFVREEDFYKRLGLQYIPPELREAMGEIEAAERGDIPELVELSDIKGDLHVHSKWSDGHDTIETMAATAKEMGYQYIAITDHSQGLGVARGLTPERLRQQMAEVEELNRKLKGFHIFTGIELDIRADGSLDLPDDVLSQLDVVVASVHSAMGQDKAKMMDRLRRALSNPNVDILAHPTCRLINEREPIELDIEELFRIALETGTALEINAMPARLDLKDVHAFRARELGVKLALGTDSHSAAHLQYMRFGVGMARRGWCEPKHILNTRSAKDITRLLGKNG